MLQNKRVFVTVGTTKFDKLIDIVSSPESLDILWNLGYSIIQFQTGSGVFKEGTHTKIILQYNSYFDNFEEEIEKSDLVISHAGAGTCLEVLQKRKPLIVVINEDLMDNHQCELAEQLEESGYVYCCTCNNLKKTLLKDCKQLKSYPEPNKQLFTNYLNKCMGFH